MKIQLSQKEKMLLEDQKSHETQCIEKYARYANLAQDQQLKQICKANEQVERSHLDSLNQLLAGTIPQINQQQGQNTQQQPQTAQQTQASQNMNPSAFGISDQSICKDMLMTEKYVSGAYDTVIFEFRDTNIRDVLNHIQKEEQKHGEAIFQYMESKGMYSVQ
ncbi:MAG: spore coat protein [Christensenellales bacterium]